MEPHPCAGQPPPLLPHPCAGQPLPLPRLRDERVRTVVLHMQSGSPHSYTGEQQEEGRPGWRGPTKVCQGLGGINIELQNPDFCGGATEQEVAAQPPRLPCALPPRGMLARSHAEDASVGAASAALLQHGTAQRGGGGAGEAVSWRGKRRVHGNGPEVAQRRRQCHRLRRLGRAPYSCGRVACGSAAHSWPHHPSPSSGFAPRWCGARQGSGTCWGGRPRRAWKGWDPQPCRPPSDLWSTCTTQVIRGCK